MLMSCYQEFKVPTEMYGENQCLNDENQYELIPLKYVYCIKKNKVQFSNEEMCNIINFSQFYKDPFRLNGEKVKMDSNLLVIPGIYDYMEKNNLTTDLELTYK